MFSNRITAGIQLAPLLDKYKGQNAIVLGVPRGGVPIAYIIAQTLQLPLSLTLTKKIGHPDNEEYAVGAVSLTDSYIVPHENVSDAYLQKTIRNARARLAEMQRLYLGNQPPAYVTGKIVIIVDDGIATGNTLLATIKMLRKKHPEKIVVAAPIASKAAYELLRRTADEVTVLYIPEIFIGVGAFYDDFSEVSDQEVIKYLRAAKNSEATN
ncbi:putative phosphoribosyltransferase [Chitinophaga polysaccharea]|uniref:Putative phosphoribosyltransferase n=1 Tax=Chitinophaga polysaccharea TaxID=1293035 RepID=A0A561P9X4_9BACT|nr:phosphoribosyltransferase family protein [Chitinophaga polysaccharea]TWF34836.1 putative phosphoribosyltransferase [Chitinophaga polysaccharea]